MSEDYRYERGVPWLFLVIAFGWTWAFWVPIALMANGLIRIPDGLTWVMMDGKPAAWGPLIAAICVAFRSQGMHGLRRILASMLHVGFSPRWYAVALLLIPAIVGTAQAIAVVTGADVPASEAFQNPISIPIAFVWIFFLGGPLQEEAGWRGTATPTLQTCLGALGASLATGIVWAVWHLPLFFQPRAEIYYNQPFWGLLFSTMLLSVLLTWVYGNTGRSLFATMLMHTSWNWANFVFGGLQTDTGGFAFLILMAAVVLIIILRFGPKEP
jgi:membrane protease YdiL (CAAX protease family)